MINKYGKLTTDIRVAHITSKLLLYEVYFIKKSVLLKRTIMSLIKTDRISLALFYFVLLKAIINMIVLLLNAIIKESSIAK